jgi:hypothetical protein
MKGRAIALQPASCSASWPWSGWSLGISGGPMPASSRSVQRPTTTRAHCRFWLTARARIQAAH